MGEDTLKQRIYNSILEEIIKKKCSVNCILKEKELSEKFEVSKAPVREALIELSKEGIVQSIPRAGYRIVQFTEKDISEATELRLILELAALDTIIKTIKKETLHNLSTQVKEFTRAKRQSTVPLDIWWNDNIRFHVALNAAGGNRLLTATLENVLHRLWRVIAQLFWSGDPQDYLTFEPDTHITLLRAIAKKNNKEARKILSEDILSIRNLFTYRP